MLSMKTMQTLPLPTQEQHNAFVKHLRDVHSWYKHLPLLAGGTFVVFLAPDAGLHYPSEHPRLPYGNTVDGYKKAFGCLDYMWRTGDLPFDRDNSKPVGLPAQVLQQCSFVLYPYVASEFHWSVHTNAAGRLRSGAFHPERESLLEWEAVISKLEHLESNVGEVHEAVSFEETANSLYAELQSQEIAKIERHLRLLYRILKRQPL